ncbi:MAG: hypothetical protein JW827_04290 [Spirochaetes bacterium]|nr:hypothetical protein [Spirochaetota bacterium]
MQIYSLFFPKEKKLLVGGQPEHYGIVMEVSREAALKGVRENMLTLDARNLIPEIQIIPPDVRRGDYFLKKIIKAIDNFSLKWVQDRYNSFYLFLPDYFEFTATLKKMQNLIRFDLGISTQIGVSSNKHMARLAGSVGKTKEILYINRQNASAVLKDINIEWLQELNRTDIEKLNLAGIRSIDQLFDLDLYKLRFFLGEKAEVIYYNYICQLKTIRDATDFVYEEIIFYNTVNNLKIVLERIKAKLKGIFLILTGHHMSFNRAKIYIEYVDDKNYIFSKKIKKPDPCKELIGYISSHLYRTSRRVRVKKIGLFVFYNNYIEPLFPKDRLIPLRYRLSS